MSTSDIDMGRKRILKLMREMGTREVAIGWFEKRKHGEGGITMGELAGIHEFGAPEANIPARPFMQPTVDANVAKYGDASERRLEDVVTGKMSTDAAMMVYGQMIRADLVRAIDAITSPPLSDATVHRSVRPTGYGRKKSTKPLVDTGALRDQGTEVKVRRRAST